MLLRSFLATLSLSLLAAGVQAQPASVFVDIGPCMAMDSDTERYACYDQLEAQIRQAQARETQPQAQAQPQSRAESRSEPAPRTSSRIQAEDLPVVSVPRNTRPRNEQQVTGQDTAGDSVRDPDSESVAGFGLDSPATTSNRQANARVLESEDGGQELVDTIAGLDERVPGQWEITLASGQVWRQVNSKRFRLREGMEVRIYPAPFGGSFRLSSADLNGFIQVRRVQ